MTRSVPAVERIADEMRDRILAGEFGDDGRLPTEDALVKEHHVSKITIRNMYTRLISMGLVVNYPRRGYFVHRMEPIALWMDRYERDGTDDGRDQWEHEVLRQGREPFTDVKIQILGDQHPAPAEVEEALGLDRGASVILRDRVGFVDGTPWMLRPSYFPEWLGRVPGGEILTRPGNQSAPGGLLRSIGHPAVTWRDRTRARMPSPEETRRLALPPGTPGIDWMRVRIAADGTPLAVMWSFLPGDRVSLVDELPAAA